LANTEQREVILSVLENADRPLTREEILIRGREQLPRLGVATVNRAIREMADNFEIVGVEYPGQPRRYELPVGREHPHFICRVCDRVFDLPASMQLPPVDVPEGFIVTGGEIVYSGTCVECAKGSKKS
jgi:Fur family transcriptional regulator, ferric uptake regulator